MKRALFIDRDGTILVEPEDEQIDSYEKFQFVPSVIRNLNFIRTKLDFDFVMVSNQDGLGTDAYPEADNKINIKVTSVLDGTQWVIPSN